LQYFFGSSSITVPHGTQEGIGGASFTEQGVDIGLGAGTPVYQVEGGFYQAPASTGYSSVFQTTSGPVESYTHISAKSFQPGSFVPAGALIGWVSPLGSPDSPVVQSGGQTYYSTGPHLEFGVYNSINEAHAFQGGLDPTAFLSTAASTGSPSYAEDIGQRPAPVPLPIPITQPTTGDTPRDSGNPAQGIWDATFGGLFNVNVGQDFRDFLSNFGISGNQANALGSFGSDVVGGAAR